MSDIDNNEGGIRFTSVIGTPTTSRGVSKHKDPRDWVDRMFQNFDKDSGEVEALEVHGIDCVDQSTLGTVNMGNDNIALLVDFAGDVETSNMLKDEAIIVLGGNRAGRGGQGRLPVPLSQFPKFLQHCSALYEFIQAELPTMLAQIRDDRDTESSSEEEEDIESDNFLN